MCGIVGYFHHKQASSLVKTALEKLSYRGQDGVGIATLEEVSTSKNCVDLKELSGECVVGHLLHAIVGHVAQPLKAKGVLVANCEIYNWQELSEKYGFSCTNDSELLLSFLDKFGMSKLDELDGVYAFAYWRESTLYLARDILGVKPVWYSLEKGFSFASEKKVLLGKVVELHPRQVLIYDLAKKTIEFTYRGFFSLQENTDSEETIFATVEQLLTLAVKKRIPNQKVGVLFSGGIDSSVIALLLKKLGCEVTLYTAALQGQTKAPDLIAAKQAAQLLDLPLRVKEISINEVPSVLEKVVPLIEQAHVVKVGVALPFYLACSLAKEEGYKVIFSGLGSEEIFAGYQRHKLAQSLNKECLSGLRKMFERDLYRDDVVTMAHGLELRVPFLDKELVSYALNLPEELKIKDGMSKYILRVISQKIGLAKSIAFRPKKAAQYGSRFSVALQKLAKKSGKFSIISYLEQFYDQANARLGVLCSTGKDSWYAAHIMQRQNYALSCLLNLQSQNQDSYMFHTPAVELIDLQAQASSLPVIVQETCGEKEKELDDLKAVLCKAQEQYAIEGVVSGAVLSNYQRDRIEQICDELGLKVFCPLWHKEPVAEMKELLQHNFSLIMVSIAADGLSKGWLGKEFDEEMLKFLIDLDEKQGFHVNGEGGEYESFVLDCPLFSKRIVLEDVEKQMENEYTGRLVIKKAKVVEK